MHALRTAITVAWIVFWVYWLASAFGVKEGDKMYLSPEKRVKLW